MMDEYPKYPVGTVLWRMQGREKDGKTEWHAVPICIEYADENKFLDAHTCGGSWNSIGKNYWLTREECLAEFEKHRANYENTGGFQKRPRYKQLGAVESDDTVFWRGEDMLMVIQHGVDGRRLVGMDELPWRLEDEPAEYGMKDQYVTLGMIRDALRRDDEWMNVITVWHQSALHGEVYQTGNYHEEKTWRLHGMTMGYA